MTDEERRSAKRSRFDQVAPPRERHGSQEEGKRSSRFDRRSRSPTARDSAAARSRSPLRKDESSPAPEETEKKKPVLDPAAAAAAAAAKINAQIQAKRGVQHVEVPPIRSAASPTAKSSSPPVTSSNVNGDIYIADGDYIKDIEVNDLRNRYTLTKGSTQKMIKEETGADVTTRGSYYPDKSMATSTNPPLYLHVTSTSKDGLERAVAKIEELMQQELPNLVDERRFRRREPDPVERDEFGRRKWPEERVPIEIEPVQGFNLRAQVVGHGGAYVKHIQQETRCRVQIKGRGSGFTENATGRESDEPMYLHIAGPDPNEVQRAKELCEDLLKNVAEQHERFKANPPQQNYGGYGHGGGYNRGGQDRGSYGGYGGYGGQQSQSPAPAQSAMSPTTPAAPGTSGAPGAAGSTDYSAQWAQYYASTGAASGTDPYAAYGGYQNYVNMYQQYYQQQAAGQSQQPQSATSASPPPPPAGSPPGEGSYDAVPPPPGM
ncbi:MAG: hypothetical protein M1817_004027 [Caeruleum heppii]|nr:MAG: hypothetical protein M1817_004027 [Caeruleum heppii]